MDSGPWEVGNETRLGLPNSCQPQHRGGGRSRGRAQQDPGVLTWLRAPWRGGVSEDGTPEPSLCASSDARIRAPVNGHRTILKGRHPELRVVSIPIHWTRTQRTGLGQKRTQEGFLRFGE